MRLCIALLLALAACAPGAASPDRMGDCMGDANEPRGDAAPSKLSHAPLAMTATVTEPPSGSSARIVRIDAIATTVVFPTNLEVVQGDAARGRAPPLEWLREMDLLRVASLPPERTVLRASHDVFDVRVAVLAEPPDQVVDAIVQGGSAELARIEAASGRGHAWDGAQLPNRIVREDTPPWKRVRFGLKRFYCDYGGTLAVDFHVRPLEKGSLAIVVSSRSGDDNTELQASAPDVLASVQVDADADLMPRALDLWRSAVAHASSVTPNDVATSLRDVKPRIVVTTKAKWLEVSYVERRQWLHLEGTDRIPLVMFSGRSFEAPKIGYDKLLDVETIDGLVAAAAEGPYRSEVHVASVSRGPLAFASESAARDAFRKAFGGAPSHIVKLPDGEPAFTSEEPPAHVLDACRTRTLSLESGRSSVVAHDCPRGK